MRIGQGYDLHRLVKGRDLILGGVKIPNETGLLGHSDADVLLHSIIDALFGAAALEDIGRHFPDTDPKYKGANSLTLLKETKEILINAGYKIINVDSTIVCEKPKLKDFIDIMRKNVAAALDTNINQVSIKAKTNEGMDATGKKEAIEALSVCLID